MGSVKYKDKTNSLLESRVNERGKVWIIIKFEQIIPFEHYIIIKTVFAIKNGGSVKFRQVQECQPD